MLTNVITSSLLMHFGALFVFILGSTNPQKVTAKALEPCNVCTHQGWTIQKTTNHYNHSLVLSNESFTCADISTRYETDGDLVYANAECELLQAFVTKHCECLDTTASSSQESNETSTEAAQNTATITGSQESRETAAEAAQDTAATILLDFLAAELVNSVPDDTIGKSILNKAGEPCQFAGKITFGGAFSLGRDDRLRSLSHAMLVGEQLVVDYVNRVRCGIHMSSGNYAIEHIVYDDNSSPEWTTSIANHLVENNVDVMFSGYSTAMTSPMAEVAAEHNKLMISPGSSLSRLYVNRSTVFAMFPPSTNYMTTATRALAEKEVGPPVRTIAVFWEDSPFYRSACGIIPSVASEYGIEVTSFQEINRAPNTTVLDAVANQLLDEQPDVIMTCFPDHVCSPWVSAMRRANLNPGAWVSSGQCVGISSVHDQLGTDSYDMLGAATWDPSMHNIDNVTGWSSAEFAGMFRLEKGDVDIPYHVASAASAISLAVQAIERADTLDAKTLADYIFSNSFQTLYGDITFDENGQNTASGLLLQWNESEEINIVYPPEAASGQLDYPMPTWLQRDCKRFSNCEASSSGNTCVANGQCQCSNTEFVSAGLGETAVCVPIEHFNYIIPGIIIAWNTIAAVVIVGGLLCLVWIYCKRHIALVKASQPIFLALIVVGSIVSLLSIPFMGFQTGYRDDDELETRLADAACMAVPWLWGMGFAFTFSALFAKVWRVKKVVKYSLEMRRQKVDVKDVLFILFSMLTVEFIILITFQLVAPLRWEREVLVEIDTFAVESAGLCTSELGWWFWAALVSANVLFLFYALVLCYQTRHIHSDFAETSHIVLVVMFLFQVLVLSIPVCALVRDQPDVFYFVRAMAVFLQNFTVLAIIFGPKMKRTYGGRGDLSQSARDISRHSKKNQNMPMKFKDYANRVGQSVRMGRAGPQTGATASPSDAGMQTFASASHASHTN